MSGERLRRVPLNKLWWDETTGLYLSNGVPFTGVAFSKRRGVLESETEYRDGLRSGSDREWYPDGSLAVEGTFRGGTIHGTYREWHKNGQLAVEQVGEFGILLSEKRWDESGRLVKEYAIEVGGDDWQDLQDHREFAHGG
jgi:antitoxin component YwqK of YwqJK toxin-antitoxin module